MRHLARIATLGPLALAVAAAAGPACRSTSPEGFERRGDHPAPLPGLRLPRAVTPVRYKAELTVDPSKPEIDSAIDIELAFAEPTAFFWLNATELTLEDAKLQQNGATIPARIADGGADFAGFALDTPAAAGPAHLLIRYKSRISSDDDRGIFSEKEGAETYVYTQFENIDARRAFPCFDEPDFKTPWQLTLTVRSTDVALGNTPVTETRPLPNGMQTVVFAETKPLPSYLVAFAVGPFDVVDAGTAGANKTPVRVAAPKGSGESARFAAASTRAMIESLESYFQIPFPYPKLDLLAVPHLVSFGAMENAGLITFFSQGCLAKQSEQTIAFERDFVDIMTHELAHQWFGDLVTLAWWDDVWLNEAFASWMEGVIIEKLKPEWSWDNVNLHSTSAAIRSDSLVTARKIRQPIASKDDIQNAFDNITYLKGSAVLRMFEAWVGEERFQRGVHGYLEKYAHKNATSADFLHAIGEAAGRDVSAPFSSFLDQPGVPRVRAAIDCSGPTPKVKLAQARYLPAGSSGSGSGSRSGSGSGSGSGGEATTPWQIPVCLRHSESVDPVCTLLSAPEAELPLTGAARCPKWILSNAGARGYYVMDLGAPGFDALFSLEPELLTVPERLALIRDAAAMMESGTLPAAEPLGHLPALMKDPNPYIQSAAIAMIANLDDRIVGERLRPKLARFVRETFGARARELGFRPQPGEPQEVRLMRPHLVHTVADRGEDAELIAGARKLAEAWVDKKMTLEDDSVHMVLSIAASRGDRAFFDRLVGALEKETDSRRRARLFSALARFRDPQLVRASLALFLRPDFDPREAAVLLGQDERVAEVSYAFVKEHYDEVLARLPVESRPRLAMAGIPFCDLAQEKDVDSFFRDRMKNVMGGPRMLEQTLETVRLCAALKSAQSASLESFLSKY